MLWILSPHAPIFVRTSLEFLRKADLISNVSNNVSFFRFFVLIFEIWVTIWVYNYTLFTFNSLISYKIETWESESSTVSRALSHRASHYLVWVDVLLNRSAPLSLIESEK